MRKFIDNIVYPALSVLAVLLVQDGYFMLRDKLSRKKKIKSDMCDFEGEVLNVNFVEDDKGEIVTILLIKESEGAQTIEEAQASFEERHEISLDEFFE
jgi:hypothetical protein